MRERGNYSCGRVFKRTQLDEECERFSARFHATQIFVTRSYMRFRVLTELSVSTDRQ